MSRHLFSISAAVRTSPAAVHAILADYLSDRPRLLPAGAGDYRVLHGGSGAGTVYRFTVPAPGGLREVRAEVEEPEPGQVLTERDLESGETRTYTIVPAGFDGGTLLTVELSFEGRGFDAWLVRTFVTPRRRRSYASALSRLADYIEVRAAPLSTV